MATRMLMSSIIRQPSKVGKKALKSETVAAVQEDDEESS